MNRQQPGATSKGGTLIVGVDFDNTIATYDELFHDLALERSLISKELGKSKMEVRDSVRKLQNGEIQWQKLQGSVYGPRMKDAGICAGVENFFHECRRRQIKVFVVSHKTEFANFDETRTNLRQSALTWMSDQRFFEAEGMSLSQEDVFFEGTRADKLQRIANLGCTHFIDDLKEVLDDEGFPSNVHKILYAPNHTEISLPGATIAASWQEIGDYFFGTDGVESGFAFEVTHRD